MCLWEYIWMKLMFESGDCVKQIAFPSEEGSIQSVEGLNRTKSLPENLLSVWLSSSWNICLVLPFDSDLDLNLYHWLSYTIISWDTIFLKLIFKNQVTNQDIAWLPLTKEIFRQVVIYNKLFGEDITEN